MGIVQPVMASGPGKHTLCVSVASPGQTTVVIDNVTCADLQHELPLRSSAKIQFMRR